MKLELTAGVTLPDVALFAFAGAPAVAGLATAPGRSLMALATRDGFKGKEAEITTVHPCDNQPGRRVFLVGLGPRKSCSAETLRRCVATLVRKLQDLAVDRVDVVIPEGLPCPAPLAVQASVEAAHLAGYRFLKHKAPPTEKTADLEQVNLVLPRRLLTERIQQLVQDTAAVCAGVCYARDLVNEPPAHKTPEMIGALAAGLATPGRVTAKVFHKPEIVKLGMGGLLSVAAGSDQPPVFVHLSYKPKNAKKKVVLVGKGITFDSGGLNIKTGTFMNNMKDDMSGAAAVLGLFHALRFVDLPVELHGLLPLTENMPGGSAVKVGDVFRAHNGKTVEVLNTDAEGRLILADGLSYGATLKPDLMIDIATLTGACVVALGPGITGALGTARQLQRLVGLGETTGEFYWELPLFDGYRDWLKSRVADVNNIGKPGKAGTVFAGLFLQEFTGDVPWIHLDIAGTAFVEPPDDKHYLIAGGTGVPIRSLFALLRTM